MADPLQPIDRASLTTSIEQKYGAGGSFGQGATKAGPGTYAAGGSIESRYNGGKDFGRGAKNAGTPGLAATNMIDSPNTAQKEFRTFAQRGVTSYQPAALDYAARHYKLKTKKYKG